MASLSVLVPVYNEQHLVSTSLDRLEVLTKSPFLSRIEVIVVDDCSKDATPEVLRRFEASRKDKGSKIEWTFLRHEKNGGKGKAIQTALARASCDVTVIHDADLEYHPEEYPVMTSLITSGRADVVYGSRFLGTHRVFLLTHYLGNRLLTFITNVLYNTMLTDMETCYKVMRTDVLRSMDLQSNGFGIEPELTAKVFKRRYKVYEVPISYDGRGYDEGKKITWRDGVVALWVLLKYRFTE